MLTFLSQKLKFILVFVLIIIGISFVFFGDWSGRGRGTHSDFNAKIKGNPVSLTDFQNSLRASRVSYTLSTGQIPGSGKDFTQALSQQAWNRLLLLSEIRNAGLTLPPEDLQEAIQKHPLFQDPAKKTFSPEAFKRFQDFVLAPQGIPLDRFMEIMRDQILIETWLTSLQDSVVIQPSETEAAANKIYGQVTMNYVQITAASAVGKIETGDDVLRAFYDKRTDSFSLPEQRKVEYILFKLPADAAAQPAEAQAKIRRELGEKAYQFTEPFYVALENAGILPDFAGQAKAAGLEVQTSPYFARNGFVFSGPTGTSLAQLAFTLTPERPISDYIQVPEGYAVLRLAEILPPATRPFETVKEEVRKAYLGSEANLRMQSAAENAALKIRSELAAGKTFAQAATAAGQKAAALPPFVPSEQNRDKNTDPKLGMATYLSQQLNPGQLSQPIPQNGDFYLFYFVERKKLDEVKGLIYAGMLKNQLLQQRRGQIREEYLARLGESKGTLVPANLFADGSN